MITTSGATAFLRFSYQVPLNPFFKIISLNKLKILTLWEQISRNFLLKTLENHDVLRYYEKENGLKFNKLPAPSNFFSQKSIEIFSSTKTLTNFFLTSPWQSLLKISHWFFIRVILLNSGSENHSSADKKTAGIFEICFLSKKEIRTTNIGKGWPNRNPEKISRKNQSLFEKENFGKILSNTFFKTFFKESLWGYEEIIKSKYQQLTYGKPNQAWKFI